MKKAIIFVKNAIKDEVQNLKVYRHKHLTNWY